MTDIRLLSRLDYVLSLNLDTWKANGMRSVVGGTQYLVGLGGVAFEPWLKDWFKGLPARGLTPVVGIRLANYWNKPVLIDWFDDAGWVVVLAAFDQRVAEAVECGVTSFHIDPEEYGTEAGNGKFSGNLGAYWYLRAEAGGNGFPAYPHTAAAQCAKAYERGLAVGRAFITRIPTAKFDHYYVKFPGGYNDKLQQIVNGLPPRVDSPMSSFFAGWIAAGGKHAFLSFDLNKNAFGPLGGFPGALTLDKGSTTWLSTRIPNWAAVKDNVSFGGAAAISKIEDGVGAFRQVYPPDYVTAQLAAMARANPITILYEQNPTIFDYAPYWPGIKAAAAIGAGGSVPVTVTARDKAGNAATKTINISTS